MPAVEKKTFLFILISGLILAFFALDLVLPLGGRWCALRGRRCALCGGGTGDGEEDRQTLRRPNLGGRNTRGWRF
jgi:hypothetical protein